MENLSIYIYNFSRLYEVYSYIWFPHFTYPTSLTPGSVTSHLPYVFTISSFNCYTHLKFLLDLVIVPSKLPYINRTQILLTWRCFTLGLKSPNPCMRDTYIKSIHLCTVRYFKGYYAVNLSWWGILNLSICHVHFLKKSFDIYSGTKEIQLLILTFLWGRSVTMLFLFYNFILFRRISSTNISFFLSAFL